MRKGISSLCGVVHEKMRSDYVQADETTTPVMNKETHKAAQNMAVVCSLLPHKWKLTHPESVMIKTT